MLPPFHYVTYDACSILSQIPFAPEDVSVLVVSGSRLEVFFCDPLISSGDIWGFLVQWDTDDDFANAIEGDDTGAGCYENGYGSCVVQDAAIAGQCPYSLLLTGLTEGEVSIWMSTQKRLHYSAHWKMERMNARFRAGRLRFASSSPCAHPSQYSSDILHQGFRSWRRGSPTSEPYRRAAGQHELVGSHRGSSSGPASQLARTGISVCAQWINTAGKERVDN